MQLKRNIPKDKSIGKPFYTKEGFLTPYSFHCGYMEIYETSERVETASGRTEPCYRVEIYKDSSVFVVVTTHKKKDLQDQYEHNFFDSLHDARERVKELRRGIKNVDD